MTGCSWQILLKAGVILDCNLVDFASRLPPRHKLLVLNEKHLLKIAFENMIPKTILKRTKQPYLAPDAPSFFSGKYFDWINEVTGESTLKNAGIFNAKAVFRFINKCRRVKGYKMSNTDNMRIVAILSTMLVHHHYIEQDGSGGKDERPAEPIKIVDRCAPHREALS